MLFSKTIAAVTVIVLCFSTALVVSAQQGQRKDVMKDWLYANQEFDIARLTNMLYADYLDILVEAEVISRQDADRYADAIPGIGSNHRLSNWCATKDALEMFAPTCALLTGKVDVSVVPDADDLYAAVVDRGDPTPIPIYSIGLFEVRGQKQLMKTAMSPPDPRLADFVKVQMLDPATLDEDLEFTLQAGNTDIVSLTAAVVACHGTDAGREIVSRWIQTGKANRHLSGRNNVRGHLRVALFARAASCSGRPGDALKWLKSVYDVSLYRNTTLYGTEFRVILATSLLEQGAWEDRKHALEVITLLADHDPRLVPAEYMLSILNTPSKILSVTKIE